MRGLAINANLYKKLPNNYNPAQVPKGASFSHIAQSYIYLKYCQYLAEILKALVLCRLLWQP